MISAGAIVTVGDDDEPALARVIDVVGAGPDRKVHPDVVPPQSHQCP